MIIHILKANDKALVSYLVNKYGIIINQVPENFIEIRELSFEEKIFLTDYFNNQSISFYYKDVNDSVSDIIILDNLVSLSKKISKFVLFNQLIFQLSSTLENYLNSKDMQYEIGNRIFGFNKAYLMGILNVTPDSFSDGGKYFSIEDAINYGCSMIEEGVDIIDIGGESTRPGAEFISEDEEKRRVLPVIEGLLKLKSDLVLSIDTTKSKVAESAIDLGTKIINDISAMSFDENMINLCSKKKVTAIIMHMQGTPKTMQLSPTYNEVVSDIYDYLFHRIKELKNNNIEKIIIDPGIGFGKNVDDNFQIIKRLKEFSGLGYPILIGLSRKSFIGKTLNLEISERDFPSSILETISLMNSARIIRTHNVKNGRMLVDLINKIL